MLPPIHFQILIAETNEYAQGKRNFVGVIKVVGLKMQRLS